MCPRPRARHRLAGGSGQLVPCGGRGGRARACTLKDPGFLRRACLRRQSLAFWLSGHAGQAVPLVGSGAQGGHGTAYHSRGRAARRNTQAVKVNKEFLSISLFFVTSGTYLIQKVLIAYLNSRFPGCPGFLCDEPVILGQGSGRGKAELTYIPRTRSLAGPSLRHGQARSVSPHPTHTRLRASSQRPLVASPSEPQPVLCPSAVSLPFDPTLHTRPQRSPACLLPFLAWLGFPQSFLFLRTGCEP